MLRLTGIGTDGFGAETVHVTVLDQPLDDLRPRTRCMRAILAQTGVFGMGFLRPVGAQQHPRTRLDPAVLPLPSLHHRDGENEIGVTRCRLRAIDDHGRSYEVLGGYGVDG